ncbi:hypothetical protein AMECASPLE_004540 [Ameca splendens]|uniref:Uncharacterized protein n=1 Tax=Ameca splendens TaxID=208324 RepID=A0ABV0XYQ8_9TELE
MTYICSGGGDVKQGVGNSSPYLSPDWLRDMSVSRPLTPTVPGASAFLCSGKATLNSCPSFWACYDIQRAATAEVNNLPWLTKPKKRSSEVRTINLRSII